MKTTTDPLTQTIPIRNGTAMFRDPPFVVIGKSWLILMYLAVVVLTFLLVGEIA
jgi:formate hydrogenlyase subunit 4